LKGLIMKFRLEIDLENSSMLNSDYNEIGMILMRDITDIIEKCKKKRVKPNFCDSYRNIRDANGNSIGHWSITNR